MASMVVVNGHVYKDNWRGRRRSDRIEYQKKREEMAGKGTVATVRNKPLGIVPTIILIAAAAWLSVAGLYQTAQSLAWLRAIITRP